jgi:hypothetical protein
MIWWSERNPVVPDYFPPGESVTCSHLEYFTPPQVKLEQFVTVISAARKALGFEQAVLDRSAKHATRYEVSSESLGYPNVGIELERLDSEIPTVRGRKATSFAAPQLP